MLRGRGASVRHHLVKPGRGGWLCWLREQAGRAGAAQAPLAGRSGGGGQQGLPPLQVRGCLGDGRLGHRDREAGLSKQAPMRVRMWAGS